MNWGRVPKAVLIFVVNVVVRGVRFISTPMVAIMASVLDRSCTSVMYIGVIVARVSMVFCVFFFLFIKTRSGFRVAMVVQSVVLVFSIMVFFCCQWVGCM